MANQGGIATKGRAWERWIGEEMEDTRSGAVMAGVLDGGAGIDQCRGKSVERR